MGAASLRRQGIYCVDLPRILLAAKTKVFCFDKTGTLTKEGLEFFGVIPTQAQNTKGQDENMKTEKPRFEKKVNDVDGLEWIVKVGLASCHTVTQVSILFTSQRSFFVWLAPPNLVTYREQISAAQQ